MSNLLSAILISAATLSNPTPPTNPTTPTALSFNISTFVNAKNQIRLALVKPATERLSVILRDDQNRVLHETMVGKGEEKATILFTVSDLADGLYNLEVRSSQGSIRKQINLSTTPAKKPVQLISLEQPE